MLDPYRMVAINLIASFLLLTGIIFYKFIYPKKSINFLFLLILICTLPSISILREGVYESGDFNIHIYRTMEFYRSLTEGIIMPSWAGELNASYGYPLHIFNYSLPYYLTSFFHLIGFSFIGSLKLFLVLNIFLSGVFMYLFSQKIFKNDLAAFVSSIFYVFAPYHLIDIHFKVVVGEILFFTILPLSFLSIYYLKENKNLFSIIITSLSVAALIISHLVLALFAGIFMLSFVLLTSLKNNLKLVFSCAIIALCISLLISLPTWLGSFLMSEYSYIQNINLGTSYFPILSDILYSPWRMGLLFQGPKGEISHLIGYSQLFIVVLLIFLLSKNKVIKKLRFEVLFWLSSFFIITFLILPYSRPIWESFPVIKIVGSHRLLLFISFVSSVLAGYATIALNKKWVIFLLIFTAISSTVLNWGQRNVIPKINDNILQNNIGKSTSEGEAHFYANTKWVDINNPWFSTPPKNHAEAISGNGKLESIIRKSTYHKYSIMAETPLKIQENTLYFPGWKGFLNGREISLSPSAKGIITTSIPKGNFTLEIRYEDIFIYKLLKTISIISLISIIIILTIHLLIKLRSFLNSK